MNFGIELRVGTNREFVTFDADGAFDDPVNLQIFGAGDLTLDLNAGAEARTAARRRRTEFAGTRSRLVKRHGCRRWSRRRRNRGWLRDTLLLGPH